MSDKIDVARFCEIEKELSLFSREYCGAPYWQYIRFFVCQYCFTNRFDKGTEITQERRGLAEVSQKLRKLLSLIKDFFFFCNPGQYDLLILKNDSLKDKFFDYWTVPDQIRSVSLRTSLNKDPVSIRERYILLPLLAFKIRRFARKLKGNTKDDAEALFLQELEERLKNEFGKAPDYKVLIDKIEEDVLMNSCYEDYYRKLFQRTNVKAILGVVYYNNDVFAEYKVAKELGVHSVELQHGVINNHHEYYFEDTSGVNNDTPEYLLTFGELHNKWIRLVEGSSAVAVGFPFQEYMIRNLESVETEDKTIIVYPVSDSRFEHVVSEFADRIVAYGYKVLIKLHPLEADDYQTIYPVLSGNCNVSFITSQSEGIYYWLKLGTFHVMASTTVGLEAMAFDHTRVCIAENVPHEQTQCLLDWGLAEGFSTAPELLDIVSNKKTKEKNSEKLLEIRNGLWKKNAANNISEFLTGLIEHA